MTADMLQNQADEISALLGQKLRIKGGTLEDQLSRTGRFLPRRLQQDLAVLIDAADRSGHPKLARTVDVAKAAAGGDRVIAHLQEIDRWEMLKDRWLGILGAIAAALIFTLIVVVYVLWKRGLV